MPQLPFAVETYMSRANPVSSQRVVNMYAEMQPEEVNAKSRLVLFGAPGVSEFADVGSGPIRAFHYLRGVMYVVSGTSFYSVSSTGVSAILGSGLQNGTGPVSIDDNGVEIMIVDGVNGFIYDTDALTWAQVSDVDFYSANRVQHVDSYFVCDRKNTNQFFASTSLDGTDWPALFFASADSQSDYTLSPINHLQQLIIAGQRSMEVWYLSGGNNFPWTRHQGVAIQIGIATPFAWWKIRESLYFLGSDRVFYRLNGTQAQRVSKHANEQIWQTYGDISDFHVFGLTWEGHDFIVLTFPTAEKTWVFDATYGLWHERESWDADGNSIGRWCANAHINAYDKHFIGDINSGKIGELSASVYTEFGNTMRGLVQGAPIHKDGHKVYMPRFEIDVEAGIGLSSGQGSDPQLVLSISDDGGRTFQQTEWRSMGMIGEYGRKLSWTGMGSFYQRTFRLEITDPVRRSIITNYVDVESEA